MKKLRGQSEFKHGQAATTGVLLCNLGTPDTPDTAAVRRYLAEFLADPRVVELPRWLWMPLLHGVILNLRPRRSAHAYQKVWRNDGAPLLRLSENLLEALKKQFSTPADQQLRFALGMRYGNPSMAAALQALLDQGARRILVVPLYPQYASATTGSVHDAVFDFCAGLRWLPQLRFVTDYHDRADYIAALAQSVRDHWQQHGRGERLLMSFHGIPQKTFLAGDPYFCQTQATGRLLAEALELEADAWQLSFQSRVGAQAWLEPYTEQTLLDWAAKGVGDIDVVCPGFAVDCLETLEEIAMQNAERFQAAGGGSLRYIPALNERDDHVAALTALISQELGIWRHTATDTAESLSLSAVRARAMGGQ